MLSQWLGKRSNLSILLLATAVLILAGQGVELLQTHIRNFAPPPFGASELLYIMAYSLQLALNVVFLLAGVALGRLIPRRALLISLAATTLYSLTIYLSLVVHALSVMPDLGPNSASRYTHVLLVKAISTTYGLGILGLLILTGCLYGRRTSVPGVPITDKGPR